MPRPVAAYRRNRGRQLRIRSQHLDPPDLRQCPRGRGASIHPRTISTSPQHPCFQSTRRRRLSRSAQVQGGALPRSEEHTSELQSPCNLVCRLLLEKKKNSKNRKLNSIKITNNHDRKH